MENFEIFQEWVKKFVKYFGLINYVISFDTFDSRMKGTDDARATVSVDRDAREAIFNFNTNDELKDIDPIRGAFHEALELLLIDFWFETIMPLLDKNDTEIWNAYSDRCDKITHDVIRTMENTVFPLVKKDLENTNGN